MEISDILTSLPVKEPKKLSIISFSGDFDKLVATFTLATGAAAIGYEVHIFFTFWGLDAIKQKQGRAFVGTGFLPKIFGFFMGGLRSAPVSRLNFLGLSPKIFRYLMRKKNVATLEEQKFWRLTCMLVKWRCIFLDYKKAILSMR